MQNKDNICFLWCVLKAINPKGDHPERLDKKLMHKENTLNTLPRKFERYKQVRKAKPNHIHHGTRIRKKRVLPA